MTSEDKSAILRVVFILIVIVAGLFAMRLTGLSVPLTVTSSSVSSELSVVGEGKVDVTPDTAYVDVGVNVESVSSADEAQKRLSELNNKIVAAVKTVGVAEENIKSSNYSISPNYIYDSGRSRQNGFNGSATITVKTEKIDLAGKIIEESTKAGATTVGGTRFVVDKPEVYREQARDKAIANAKEQAEKLASSLGIRLGRITNVVESNSDTLPPVLYAEKAMALDARGGAAPVSANLEPGTQTVTSVVTLYFEKR